MILAAVESVNDMQKGRLLEKITQRLGRDLAGKTIAVWGLAFKANTDDMREAPSQTVIRGLLDRGASVMAYDPVAMDEARRVFGTLARLTYADSPMGAVAGADAMVVVTEWQEFRSPDFSELKRALRQPLLFDGRNLFDPKEVRAAGLEYFGIGRP
jgi:UDPglucose 6-dehydrogenase